MRNLIVLSGRVVSREFAFATLIVVLLGASSFAAQTAQPSAPKQAPAPPKQSPTTPKPAAAANEKTAEQADLPSARSIIGATQNRHVVPVGSFTLAPSPICLFLL